MYNLFDVKLYSLVKKTIGTPRSELEYALCEWANGHPELEDLLARYNDTYLVKYIGKDGFVCGSKSFDYENSENPFKDARKFFFELSTSCSVIELWKQANPYYADNRRRGELLLSI